MLPHRGIRVLVDRPIESARFDLARRSPKPVRDQPSAVAGAEPHRDRRSQRQPVCRARCERIGISKSETFPLSAGQVSKRRRRLVDRAAQIESEEHLLDPLEQPRIGDDQPVGINFDLADEVAVQ